MISYLSTILESLFLSIWFREWFLIFPEENTTPINNNTKKEPHQLYLQIFWKLFYHQASVILPEYRHRFPNLCILFKTQTSIGAIIPVELNGLSEHKCEEKLITYFRRYSNAFSINPHMKIYFQLDTPLDDQHLIEHFGNQYPRIKMLFPEEPIPSDSGKEPETKTLVITQETLSFLVSFLYFNFVYRFMFRRLTRYRLLIDKEVAINFDQRMESQYSNWTEKNRWEELKSVLIRVDPQDLAPVPQYMKMNNCNFSREMWIIDNAINNQWDILFWKKNYRQTRHLSCLLSANIILRYIFIYDKGLIQGSKGEKESYFTGNQIHKFFVTLAFNWRSFWFSLTQL